jgi:RNA polymerase sigma-70 factor, ECF subfamily
MTMTAVLTLDVDSNRGNMVLAAALSCHSGKSSKWLSTLSRESVRISATSASTEDVTENATSHAMLMRSVAIDRNRSAFGELFAYYAPRLKSFMLRRGVSSETAEDVVQETMVNVWRKAHLFDQSKASASTWIFSIGRNAHIDLVRKFNRPELDPNDPALVPEPAPEATAVIGAAQDADQVKKALAALPSDQREVLVLSFFEDKPHSEIATQLNLPLGTVKSRIRLAFAKMRERLGEN